MLWKVPQSLTLPNFGKVPQLLKIIQLKKFGGWVHQSTTISFSPSQKKIKLSLFPHYTTFYFRKNILLARYSLAPKENICPCFYLYVFFSFSGFLFNFESSTAKPEYFFHSYLQISGKYFIDNKAAL